MFTTCVRVRNLVVQIVFGARRFKMYTLTRRYGLNYHAVRHFRVRTTIFENYRIARNVLQIIKPRNFSTEVFKIYTADRGAVTNENAPPGTRRGELIYRVKVDLSACNA